MYKKPNCDDCRRGNRTGPNLNLELRTQCQPSAAMRRSEGRTEYLGRRKCSKETLIEKRGRVGLLKRVVEAPQIVHNTTAAVKKCLYEVTGCNNGMKNKEMCCRE